MSLNNVLHPRTRFRLDTALFLLAFVAITAAYATFALAFQSDHAQLTLVWNDGQHDCADLPMTLVGDHLWECTVPVQADVAYYCQFWTGGVDDPKYGADLFDPNGLVLDVDPSSLVVVHETTGYRRVLVDEALASFAEELAPASIVLDVAFSDPAASAPADLHAVVDDLSSGLRLGDYVTGTPMQLTGLLPGRTYSISVGASGYETQSFELAVPDATPVHHALTLERRVANERSSWGGLKTLYRR